MAHLMLDEFIGDLRKICQYELAKGLHLPSWQIAKAPSISVEFAQVTNKLSEG